MKDWNVVVSVFQDGFRRAIRSLQQIAPVERSPYHNVLVMRVDDPMSTLTAIERKTEESPALYDSISRVAPVMHTFEFHSAEAFAEHASSILRGWSERLGGRSFHVRLHRRGGRHQFKTPDMEKKLNEALLAATQDAGVSGRVSFSDPDAVIAIDTVDDRAGVALWTRDDLKRHRLLRPD